MQQASLARGRMDAPGRKQR